jgi:glycosyltransferase involved in cell wall biosynthesis
MDRTMWPTAPSRRYKILYVQIHTTSYAGIERVVDTMCELLADRYGSHFEIDVLQTSIHKGRPDEPRKFNAIIKRARGKIGLMRAYRDALRRKDYDLVVVPQIEPTVICMLSAIGLKRKFAVYLHGNPRLECNHLKARILFFLMRRFLLAHVSSVFGISARQLESFQTMFDSKRPQYQLPNPVRRFVGASGSARAETGYVTFVNVGRFDTQKGQDILLEAFAELLKNRSDVRLKLVGHGSMEGELREIIRRLGIGKFVAIEHHPVDPEPALVSSDVFVATSRWEGWSLAICEALRFGLPVISTDCEFGPNEILVEDRLGRLVPLGQQDKLVDAMLYYCEHLEDERQHQEYRKEFIDRYSPELVADVHAKALYSTLLQS